METLLGQELGTPTTDHLSLTDFKRTFWRNYTHIPYMDRVDDALTQVTQYVKSGGASGISRLMIFMPPRHGKCIVAGTPVTLMSGERKPIEQICPSDMVISLDTCYNTTYSKVVGTHDNGVKPVLKITLMSGRYLVCTENHPLLTVAGWIPSMELKVGDRIAVHRKQPVINGEQLPYGAAALLGYVVGDGTFSPATRALSFTTADRDVVTHLSTILAAYGWQIRHRDRYDYSLINPQKLNRKRGDSPTGLISQYMERALARDKCIPDIIFTASDADVAQFLAAYFNCDGTVTSFREGVAEFYSVSERLLEGAQQLLARFGIYSTLRIKKAVYKDNPHVSYRLVVSGQDLVNMADLLPVVGSKGQKLRGVADSIRDANHYPEYESIPNGWQQYLKIGKGTLRLQHGIRVDKHYKRGTARHIVNKIAEIDCNPDLQRLCNPDVIWERIVSIEEVGEQPTFDIEVEDTHNYSVGGIVSHNTLTVSRLFPAWLLSHAPDLRLIMASYGATLAHRNSRVVRNLIAREDYQAAFPAVRLASDSAAVDEWDIAGRDGGLIAAGVGGGVTGHGANIIIIDDVVKSRAEAESATYRQRVKDWYENDLLTRLEEPGGAIIIMLTRWHEDDLAGYLLASEAHLWHVITLPALANADDPLGREVGAALWPERYSEAILTERRARMGEYAFASLYQQQPIPSGNRLFDTGKIEIIDYEPDCKSVVRFYDLAVTAKRQSDYTVGLKLGITDDEDLIVLDVYRAQKTAPDVERDIVQNAHIDGSRIHIILEAEKAGIIQLDYLLRNARMRGFVVRAVAPQGDKFTRAQPVASRVVAGKLKLHRAAWNRAFLDELSVFPSGEHDDQVDALSGAYANINTMRLGLPTFIR